MLPRPAQHTCETKAYATQILSADEEDLKPKAAEVSQVRRLEYTSNQLGAPCSICYGAVPESVKLVWGQGLCPALVFRVAGLVLAFKSSFLILTP